MGNYHVRFGGRERRVLIEARPSRPNAEMGSAFLCASLGIVPTVRHADYLGRWLAVLREDSRAIFRAARAASLAADWLLERHRASRDCDGGTKRDAPASDTGAEQGRAA